MSKIEINNIYKIFGNDPDSVMGMVQNGSTKDEVLEQTGHTVGLDNVSLNIEEGETFVCMGLSGSGKSTLIRHLNRLIDPTAGEILIDGENVMSFNPEQLIDFRRHKMSMVFQRFGLFPHKTVMQNVGYGLEMQGKSEDERDKVYGMMQDVNAYKELTQNSFQKYENVVTEYKNFHEKLTGNIKYQGKFNEIILKRLLEKNGFKENIDFIVGKKQSTYDADENKTKDVKPDFILQMPEDKNIIVDCKVSLDNWTQFINEKDPKERDRQLTKHIDSVKDHIKKLSNKNYNKLYNLNSFQSIIMFMPFETSYISVLEKDQDLLDEAFKSNILLSGPSSFMALLKIIEQLKSQQKQVDNISKVIGSAEIIFDKYVNLKESIKKAISSYNSHAGHLKKIVTTAYGNQGLEKQIKKLKDEHGLLPGKQLSDISSEESVVANIDDPESEENKWN